LRKGKVDIPMQILGVAVLYFLLVFGAGFVLGTVRVLVVVPQLGERSAELLEMPLMLIVVVIAARWIVHHRLHAHRLSSALSVGFLALGIMLFAELAVGMWLRGLSATEVFLNRDPVSGAAYYASLLLLAIMPTILVHIRPA
jgi:hypothetical protein